VNPPALLPKRSMGTYDESSEAVDELVDELLRLGGGLTLILEHMARAARTAPLDGQPADVILRALLCDVLEVELGDDAPRTIRATATMLRRACETIGRDLFLMEPVSVSPRRHRRVRPTGRLSPRPGPRTR
jgi:predicted HD phosphohydrolase